MVACRRHSYSSHLFERIANNQIEIGLSGRDTLLLALTLFLSLLTFGTGRTNILSGLVHLVVFATFLFLVFVP